ncbi:MAG: DUF368 domain-containing protein, partial [Deltaproteobacteria bacterium]|nr:DUF368 domain-containing protein [Deltaproteobacteria bacterium]
ALDVVEAFVVGGLVRLILLLVQLRISVFIYVFSLAKIITSLLDQFPIMVWSFFFGLILASIFVVKREIKTWNPIIYAGLIISSVSTYFLVGMIPVVTPHTWWFTIFAGIISIIAMVLPGISGSFILVLVSQYQRILEAVKSLDWETLSFFYLGTMIGLVSIARILGYMFSKFHSLTMAVLTGFMIGSIRKIWPFKEIVHQKIIDGKIIPLETRNILPDFNLILLKAGALMLLGIAVVLILEWISGRKKQ